MIALKLDQPNWVIVGGRWTWAMIEWDYVNFLQHQKAYSQKVAFSVQIKSHYYIPIPIQHIT